MSTFAKIESSVWRQRMSEVSDSEIYEYMKGQGMDALPPTLIFDGEIHRFPTDPSKYNDDAGWYSAIEYMKGFKVVCFGDFRKNLSSKFESGSSVGLTEDERLEVEYRIEQKKREITEERKRYHNEKARQAEELWNRLPFATVENGYLQRKKILPHNTKTSEDGRLVVPLFNEQGELRSLQFIPSEEGEKKKFFTGAETKGCFWWIGDPDSQKVFLCEGFATASSVHESTGSTVFIAFSCFALAPTARILQEHGKAVTVVADNDDAGISGAKACEGCQVVTIPNPGQDANDYQNETGNLKEILPDLSIVSKMILADDILSEDLTVSWLIKGWIPTGSIGMIHGPSASGKTTIMLDMLLSASSGMPSWLGNRIKRPVNTVYLCGEGLVGVKRRLRAWKADRGVDSLGHFAVYPLPLDLDRPEGIHEIRTQIETLGWKPDIVIIDTVNRYMSGDENSAQDTRTLLNCVDSLRSLYQCSGLYVHHTGNSEETQKRARGSSAWRGALDYEISVAVDEESGVRCVEQVKMKDTELMPKVYGIIEGADIPGLYDDEGEQVTGAVFNAVDKPEDMVDPKLEEAKFLLYSAYTESGKSDNCISYSYLKNWLIENRQVQKKTAEKMMNPSEEGRFIGRLIKAGLVYKENENFYLKPSQELGFINEMNRKKYLTNT